MIKRENNSTVVVKVNKNNLITNTTAINTHVAHPIPKVTAKADTGTSQHYFKTSDTSVI